MLGPCPAGDRVRPVRHPRTPTDLKKVGIETTFDHIFVSIHLGMTKPAPVLYRHATTAMGVPTARILIVDDLPVSPSGRPQRWHADRMFQLGIVVVVSRP